LVFCLIFTDIQDAFDKLTHSVQWDAKSSDFYHLTNFIVVKSSEIAYVLLNFIQIVVIDFGLKKLVGLLSGGSEELVEVAFGF
jgi:hypothetical protein